MGQKKAFLMQALQSVDVIAAQVKLLKHYVLLRENSVRRKASKTV